MNKMSFGQAASSCPYRIRKLQMIGRKKPMRRPIEMVLDQQFSPNVDTPVVKSSTQEFSIQP